MGRNHWILIALPILVWGCSTDQEPLQTQNLLGVWSGTLFQTESAWDSAVVQLEGASPELFLYQEGKPENYPLSQQGELLSVRGSGGLRFDAFLPTEQGPLRGVLTHDLWVQSLEFTAKDTRWVAPVTKPEIIDTDYQVFLHFFQDSLGDLQANIQSNKENRELHFLIEKVSLEGNQIAFNITNPRFSISATYKPGEPGLSLAYGNAGGKRTVPLAKLPENQWGGYLPRSRTEPYTYQIPEAAGAWLPTASLAEVGISPSALDFMGEIKKGTYTHIHSVIITKDDKLVLEEYFHGYHRQYLHDIRSAFKSIASLAVGKAMMQQETLTPNSPLLDYYPEYQISDPQKSQINVRHALTMSTGLQLEDEDAMQWEHPDWVQYKLSLPMQHDPGTVYEYSSGGTQLLSGAIQQATNTYLPLFLYQELLLPMGIHQFQMLTSPAGRGYLADNFYLRALDFAKFGHLLLHQGEWQGKPILDPSWIQQSTSPQIVSTYPEGSAYGYLWRLLERRVGDQQVGTIEAWGNGGQFLIILPDLNMTVSFTGGNYNLFPEMETPLEILDTYILPAIQAD